MDAIRLWPYPISVASLSPQRHLRERPKRYRAARGSRRARRRRAGVPGHCGGVDPRPPCRAPRRRRGRRPLPHQWAAPGRSGGEADDHPVTHDRRRSLRPRRHAVGPAGQRRRRRRVQPPDSALLHRRCPWCAAPGCRIAPATATRSRSSTSVGSIPTITLTARLGSAVLPLGRALAPEDFAVKETLAPHPGEPSQSSPWCTPSQGLGRREPDEQAECRSPSPELYQVLHITAGLPVRWLP